eukprot:TRINITY_DN615_c0_g2_i1.p1 TRINITY_DN615_c0_g2~~TRINITY_DN615_c0_g2_i1.p1  ORF type:complete len:714 (-),score=361.37 TRINITY_DN615_c0_g2_i1:123-2264(-)
MDLAERKRLAQERRKKLEAELEEMEKEQAQKALERQRAREERRRKAELDINSTSSTSSTSTSTLNSSLSSSLSSSSRGVNIDILSISSKNEQQRTQELQLKLAAKEERKNESEQLAQSFYEQKKLEREAERKKRAEERKREEEELLLRMEERNKKRQERESKKKQEEEELRVSQIKQREIEIEQENILKQKQETKQAQLAIINSQKEAMLKTRFFNESQVIIARNYRLESYEFQDNKQINLSVLKQHLFEQGLLEIDAVLELVKKASNIFQVEPNVFQLQPPLTIIGDIHGQFYDFLSILDKIESPESRPILLLGDYVDRGQFSIETVLYLYALKICYPDSIYILRGNHESRKMNEFFNFKSECLKKYNEEVFEAIIGSFEKLPIAAVVQTQSLGKILCLHGGIGPDVRSIEQISNLNRFQEIPEFGALCDLMWADPADERATAGYPQAKLEQWRQQTFFNNKARGISYHFFYKAAIEFLQANNLSMIVRGHEVQRYGFEEHKFKLNKLELPLVITIFSAPNYCGMYENQAAVMVLNDDSYDMKQIGWVEPPYVLPDFQNGFQFSMPSLLENLLKFFATILEICNEDEEDSKVDETREQAKLRIRAKLRNMTKLIVTMKEKRETTEATINPIETLSKLKAMNTSIPKHTLFDEIATIDLDSEKRWPTAKGAQSRSYGSLLSLIEKKESNSLLVRSASEATKINSLNNPNNSKI